MKRICLVFVLTIGLLPGITAIEFENLSFDSKILGRAVNYSVVLPEGYNRGNKLYPVVYMLHGLGDNASSWLEYGSIAQISQHLCDTKAISPFIIVAPEGNDYYYTNFYDGTCNYQDMFVKEMLPMIDSVYRTKPDASQRAVIGYSMGGFGALMIPMNHPDLFAVSIPLSASIRTHSQYATEEQDGWNRQWGRIFGGVNEQGASRFTSYYKHNSPFFAIETRDVDTLNKVSYFIDNGDKEGTLCRSNEELHMLMLEKGISHQYRVRSGGHEFAFWRSGLQDAFCFADAKFRNRPFVERDQVVPVNVSKHTPLSHVVGTLQGVEFDLYYPHNPDENNREYATLYVLGASRSEGEELARIYTKGFKTNRYPALMICVVPDALLSCFTGELTSLVEQRYKGRSNRRYRAVWGINQRGAEALEAALIPDQMTYCALTHARIEMPDSVIQQRLETHPSLKSTLRLYIDTPSFGEFYVGNGKLHIQLRECGITHEYRARNVAYPSLYFADSVFEHVCKRIHH